MSANKKSILITVIIVLILTLTGCANRVEINDRSFVLGVAIDKPKYPEETSQGEDSQDSQFLKPEAPPEDQLPRYAMTIETPIIRLLVPGGGGGEGQGSENKWVITSTGNTIWDIERHLSLRVSRQDFYGHLKTIIISEEVAKEGIHPVLDFFSRRREVQQNIKLAISNGEARKLLEVTPLEENFASFYIDNILNSLHRTGAKVNTNMLQIRRSLADSGNAVLPRIRATSSKEIVAGGAAVLKDWKFVGWLSELETSGYNIVTGQVVGGAITVVDPKNRSELISLLLRGSEQDVNLRLVNNVPIITFETDSEWDIVEKGSTTILGDQQYITRLEELVKAEWQRRALNVIDKMQREYKADIFGFGSMVAQQYPDYWEKVKEDWDDKYFPELKVEFKATAKIRRTETKL